MTHHDITDITIPPADICGRCGLPIHSAESGIEYRGDHRCHKPYRCIYLLHEKAAADKAAAFLDGAKAMQEAAANHLKKRREDYHEDHGSMEPDTGVWNYPGDGSDFVAEWEELEEAIRAIDPAALGKELGVE